MSNPDYSSGAREGTDEVRSDHQCWIDA